MRNAWRVMLQLLGLLASLCATAQAGESTRKIVLPNPQLIHCRAAGCSQLWKQDSDEGEAVYPAQVLTDLVKGELVALTAVYDKSVSTDELRAAVNKLYRKEPVLHGEVMTTWRIEPEQFAISIFEGTDGAKKVTYLKFGKYSDLVPTAHLDCRK